jgi:alkylation response protein AidB-like acyl-CoA dehydrogenase
MGGDLFTLCLALEELARVDQSVAITLEAGVSLGAMPVHRFGTEEQQAEWLPLLTSGRALGAFGLTEAGAGSDAGGTRTTAVLEDGQWRIDGSKAFITNSGTDITRLVTVTAVTGELASGRKEISSILVPVPTPGFTAGPAYDKVGWNASDTHPLTFEGVRVPEENLLGTRGRGYANFLSILDEGRIAIAALAVGAAQGCVDESVQVRQGALGVRPPDRARTRRSRSRSPGWRRGRWRRGPPTTTPRPRCSPACRSRRRRRWPSWSPARPPWTTPATPPRCTAATAS